MATAPVSVSDRNSEPAVSGQVDVPLQVAQSQVKWVELASGSLTYACGLLGFLFAIIFIDHWLFNLGILGRLLALVVLLAGSVHFVWKRLWPVLHFGINPLYAAREIERVSPNMKNSLINYLLLRGDERAVHPSVFNALRLQAESGLSRVPLDTVIDRSRSIQLAWLLTGLIVVLAAYKVVSPKDPFRSIARILAPWADLSRPTRVLISDVQPGNVNAYYGQTVEVSAQVVAHGVGGPGEVSAVFSTLDGQTVERRVPLLLSSSGQRFAARLPAADDGIQQSIRYRIEAGDSRTGDFQLTVLPAPSITVERLEYDYPRYTGLAANVLTQQGDIHAIEGTRVTIHAKANQKIRSAQIEFDPGKSTRSLLPMQISDQAARYQFVLALDENRQGSQFRTYQIRFVSEDGVENERRVIHTVDVTPDLPPDIEFLQPESDFIDVAADGQMKLEIRAIDPDFGLRRIHLQANTGSQEIWSTDPLDADPALTGQVVTTSMFVPQSLGLQAGDEISYWAVAEDNRTSPTGVAEPNSRRTAARRIRITAAKNPQPSQTEEPTSQPDSDPAISKSGRPQIPKAESPKRDRNKKRDDQEEPGPAGETQTEEGSSGTGGASGKPDSGSKSSKNNKEDSGAAGTAGSGDGGEQDSSQTGDESRGGESPSGASTGGASPGGESSSADNPRSTSGQSDRKNGNESGERNSDRANEPASNESSARDSGDSAPSTGSGAGRSNNKSNGATETRTDSPHDGEVFEKALERMRQDELKQDSGTNPKQGKKGMKDGNRTDSGNDQSAQPTGSHEDVGKTADDAQNSQVKDEDGQSSTASGGTQSDNATNPSPGNPPGAKPASDSSAKPAPGPQPGDGAPSRNDRDGLAGNEKNDPTSPPSDSNSGDRNNRRDSKSQGNSGGDKRGGGKQGGGQGSDDAGVGSSGSNTDADAGADGGNQQGEGQTGTAEGTGAPSEEPTGKPGTESGMGTQSKPGTETSGAATSPDSGTPTENSKKTDSSKQSDNSKQTDTNPEKSTSNQSTPAESRPTDRQNGQPGQGGAPSDPARAAGQSPDNKQGPDKQGPDTGSAGGRTSDTPAANESANGESAAGEGTPTSNAAGGGANSRASQAVEREVADGPEANQEYAKRATEMALEYLKNQQDNPDPALLKELGWTREELKAFIDRWEALKRSARENPAQKREFDGALESLGLRPSRDKKRSEATRNDNRGGNRDAGNRSLPPSSYQEQINAFRKGVSRAKDRP